MDSFNFFLHILVIFVMCLKCDEHISGYIFWAQKSGFRPEVILELDQMAIHPEFQRKGLSKRLIESLIFFTRKVDAKSSKY